MVSNFRLWTYSKADRTAGFLTVAGRSCKMPMTQQPGCGIHWSAAEPSLSLGLGSWGVHWEPSLTSHLSFTSWFDKQKSASKHLAFQREAVCHPLGKALAFNKGEFPGTSACLKWSEKELLWIHSACFHIPVLRLFCVFTCYLFMSFCRTIPNILPASSADYCSQ